MKIKSGNPAALRNAIVSLYKNPLLGEKIGAEARRFVTQNYNSQTSARDYKKLYNSILKGHEKNKH